MHSTLEFVLRHGYTLVFLIVLTEQAGLPIPALPVLLAAGALAGQGKLSLPAALALAVVASLIADFVWYELGWRRGHSILRLLCRISLEPDSCVRRTENLFAQRGARSLLVAKFIPGLSTASATLAGMLRMRLWRFLAWDAAGALLWAGALAGVGFIFSAQLDRVAVYAQHLGAGLLVLLVGSFSAYIAFKYYQRQRFIRELRIARITPEELKQKLDAGEDIVVVDLRHSVEFEADNMKVPGAIHLDPEDIEQRHLEIPRDRDVVLYCT
jgi:membrane protein DedA with SNARE-associated domain